MHVPFSGLLLQYKSIQSEIDLAISSAIQQSSFIGGPLIKDFEDKFAKLVNAPFCISCANGTDSLFIALKALGIGPGDEVIVPAHTWISTSEAVTMTGAQVVFADTELHRFTIDPIDLENKITKRTVGIIPVHLYGHPCDMDKILDISLRHNLWVLEDCAQAHLATYKGQHVGSFGSFASYSFYPGKNLGAMGDAGALTTNSSQHADYAVRYARHGGLFKGDHQIEGMNSRMDAIQASILSVKIQYIAKWTSRRRYLAARYIDFLSDVHQIRLPSVHQYCDPSWHLFVIKTSLRDELKQYLSSQGIDCLINSPVMLPFLPAYNALGHKPSDFPNSYSNQSCILSLPLYPEMSDIQQDFVVDRIKQFFKT